MVGPGLVKRRGWSHGSGGDVGRDAAFSPPDQTLVKRRQGRTVSKGGDTGGGGVFSVFGGQSAHFINYISDLAASCVGG